ncbi:MAG: FAD-dependent oxidoreductase, partial [Hydrocarboniphaga effusa]|nr:FAD-dependent oxidoreductase [Hydrocarboniphaga effusa]
MGLRKHEVVVVGGGVVGAATALALFRLGLDVALVERGAPPAPFNPDPYDPRVYALSPGTARFLDSLGVWNRIAATRVSRYERMRVWENDPAHALTFDAAQLAAPELGFIVEDGLLRSALWSALGGATVYAGAQAAGFHADEKAARLELDNGMVLDAALVIAAEGAD